MTTTTFRASAAKRRGRSVHARQSGRPRGRLRFLWIATFIGFACLVYRAASLQISPPAQLQDANEQAREQRLDRKSVV